MSSISKIREAYSNQVSLLEEKLIKLQEENNNQFKHLRAKHDEINSLKEERDGWHQVVIEQRSEIQLLKALITNSKLL